MNLEIVEDAGDRVRNSQSIQLRMLELKKEIRQRYESDLVGSSLLTRLCIGFKMYIEFRKERRKIIPSLHALYGTHNIKS